MSASASTAYLLVSHGSRDPRPGQGMDRLAQFVRSPESGLWSGTCGQGARDQRPDATEAAGSCRGQRYRPGSSLAGGLGQRASAAAHPGDPSLRRSRLILPQGMGDVLVGTATLESEAVPLHQQIAEFGRRAQAAGAQRLRILPLFLLAGVHVTRDIPAEIDQAQHRLGCLSLEISPHLGSHPGMADLLQAKLGATSHEAVILLSHGSRRPQGNGAIASLAQALGATAAFWAVPPSLEAQVIQHIQAGRQRLAILPYFLFTGTLTDAITHSTEELAERFPSVDFHLLPPLGPSAAMARLVVDLALDQVPPQALPSAVPMRRVAFRHTLCPSSLVS